MYIHRFVYLIVLLVFMLVACGRSVESTDQMNDTNDTSATVMPSAEPTIVATEAPLPTTTNVPVTATVVPISGVPALESFGSLPVNMRWADTFDVATSGWEPRYEGPAVPRGVPAYNTYADGAYAFMVRADLESSLLWDFNNQQPLPAYPYTILAEVDAQRDSYAVMIADYQGDFGSLDTGNGIAVLFSLKEQETTLGAEFASGLGTKVAIYEFRAGDTWELMCDTTGTWPEVRTAVVALHVDSDRIGLELASHANASDRVTKICQRSSPSIRTDAAYLGLAAMYAKAIQLYRMSPEAQADDIGMLRYQTVVMAERKTPLEWKGGVTPANLLSENGCVNTEQQRRMTNELRAYYGYDSRGCDSPAIDGQTLPLQIVPYPVDVASVLGSWQCGSDTENRITITQRGAFLQLTNMHDTYGMISITDDFAPERGVFFLVSNVFVTASDYIRSTDQLAMGMRLMYAYADPYNLAMVYQDDVLKTNWAGDCVRQ
jgi:hypothetical protein